MSWSGTPRTRGQALSPPPASTQWDRTRASRAGDLAAASAPGPTRVQLTPGGLGISRLRPSGARLNAIYNIHYDEHRVRPWRAAIYGLALADTARALAVSDGVKRLWGSQESAFTTPGGGVASPKP